MCIRDRNITDALRLTCTLMGPQYGFSHRDISARSLRASGAMALLCASVDTDIIRLIGRWRSDEMLRYLHVQAEPVMRDFSARMLQHGTFTLLPNREVPMFYKHPSRSAPTQTSCPDLPPVPSESGHPADSPSRPALRVWLEDPRLNLQLTPHPPFSRRRTTSRSGASHLKPGGSHPARLSY